MSSALGLIELLAVLLGVMGWGVYELWSLRRPSRIVPGKGEPATGGRGDGESSPPER